MHRVAIACVLLLVGVSLSCTRKPDLPPPESPVITDDPVVDPVRERKHYVESPSAFSSSSSFRTSAVRRAAKFGVDHLQTREGGGSAQEGTRLSVNSETAEMLGLGTSDRRLRWEAGLEVNGNGDAVEVQDVGIAGDRLSVSHSITNDQINVKWKTEF